MKFPVSIKSLAACTVLAIAASAGSLKAQIILYQFSTALATPQNIYDASKVSTFAAPDVSGPADGTALLAGSFLPQFTNTVVQPGFQNSQWTTASTPGFSLFSPNGVTLDNSTEFATGYFTFTVTATSGVMNLSSLEYNMAKGNTTGTRNYAIYASVNGGSFALTDTPLFNGGTTGTRAAPEFKSLDLNDPLYQGVSSVTFRFYPLTSSAAFSVDFTGMTVNGTVVAVPEPGTIALAFASLPLLGLVVLRSRRKA